MHIRPAVTATVCLAIIAEVLLVVLPALPPPAPTQPAPVATSTPVVLVSAATSAPPVVVLPVQKKPPVIPHPSTPPTPPVITALPSTAVGTTTLALQSIPLLVGGVVHAGEWVPISYLQVTNVGQAGARFTGFSITQQGSAPDEALIGLSTVDDRGGSRSSVGGNQSAKPFEHGVALIPTDVYFAPGQERLFTIKAMISHQTTAYVGKELILVVSSVESTAAIQAAFPISGTTWTIVE